MENNTFQSMGHREFLEFGYALINPMQLEPDQWRDLRSEPLCPKGFGASLDLLPRIVALNVLSPDKRSELLMRSERWLRATHLPLFGALLRSSRSLEELVAHFRGRMTITNPDKQTFWLRFHDPRVFARLDRLLNNAQMRLLFGPVDTWAWFDTLAAQWHCRHKPDQPEQYISTALDAAQWSALHRLPLLNRCLKRLARDGQVPADPAGYRALAERVDASLYEASSLGILDRDDACAYALNVERHGREWANRRDIREALEQAASGQQSLVRSLADMERLQNASNDANHSTRYA